MIPLHPVAVDDRTLRWVTDTAAFEFDGAVRTSPGRLGELQREGVLARVRVDHGGIETTLAEGLEWRDLGAVVRSALHAALQSPAEWAPGPGAVAASAERRTEAAVRAALDGDAGDLIRSHAGTVELIEVRDGVARLRLGGSCVGCPALDRTLHGHLLERLQRAVPQIRDVRTG